MVARLVVLASGAGTNLQAILACEEGRLPAEVVAVVSDHADAGALARAGRRRASRPPRAAGEVRPDYDARLADVVAGFGPDFVVLAGWMRILTMNFLGWFPDRVVNLHPALPGEVPGIHAIERAWHEALAGERTRTGVMVHLVPSESVDAGPVRHRRRADPARRHPRITHRPRPRHRARVARRHIVQPVPGGGAPMNANDELFDRFEALTFDDVVVVPGYSETLPDAVDTSAASRRTSRSPSRSSPRWTR